MSIKNWISRPIVFVYAAVAASVALGVGFNHLQSRAESPGYLAEWDIPPTGSTRILDFYHMTGPMNYRGWPYYFAKPPNPKVAGTREIKVSAIRAPIREARQPRPVMVARIHNPAVGRASPPVAVAKTNAAAKTVAAAKTDAIVNTDTCWHLLIGDLFCKRSTI
jgi:hypothetical protein